MICWEKLLGKTVFEGESYGTRFPIPLQAWSEGLYTLKVWREGQPLGFVRMVRE